MLVKLIVIDTYIILGLFSYLSAIKWIAYRTSSLVYWSKRLLGQAGGYSQDNLRVVSKI